MNEHSWIERIGQFLSGEPRTQTELLALLKDAAKRHLIDLNSLGMIEGVLHISKLRVRDIMIPRSQMQVLECNMTLEEALPIILQTVHSRFPVIGSNKDEVLGILLAKDLLNYTLQHAKPASVPLPVPLSAFPMFSLQPLLRKAVFVPESKRLDVLLQEFRTKRNHMAIVVDEYGGVTGLVTIEDVLEEIVGEIEDEYDDEDSDQLIRRTQDNVFQVKALTSLDIFNDFFHTHWEDKEVETIGGLVTRRLGHLPAKGEVLSFNGYTFKILRADTRRIHLLQVTPDKNDVTFT